MPGAPVRLGPFTGGINIQSDASSIADNELVDCVNFDIDLDGSLISRAPVVDITATTNMVSVMGNGRIICLGYGIFSLDRYFLFASGLNGVGVWNGTTWTLVRSGLKSKSITQYGNKVYICATPDSSAPGGWYDPDATPKWTDNAAQPKGSSIVAWRDRLWIAGGPNAPITGGVDYPSRVHVSGFDTAPHPETWTDFIDFNPGDGQAAITLLIYNDSLIVFKTDSTFKFTFTTDPGDDGQETVLSKKIGTSKEFCALLYENVMYTFHEGWVYEVNNFVFTRINDRVPFIQQNPSTDITEQDVYIYLLGDRLVTRYFGRVYVFQLRARAWTRYISPLMVGVNVAAPSADVRRKNLVYYAGSAAASNAKFYRIVDGVDPANTEEMTCSIKTKNYDMGISYRFKKLFWWGADVLSTDRVKAVVEAVALQWGHTTWGMLGTHEWSPLGAWAAPLGVYYTAETGTRPVMTLPPVTWHTLREYEWHELYTWGNPLNILPFPIEDIRPARVFVKFLKALRYRQVNFSLILTTNGAPVRGPVKIYSITAFTNAKELVAKQVS